MRMFKALRGVCVVACIATTVTLAFGAEVGLAADYQDAKGNVCEGTFSPGSCEWGTHVFGQGDNVALGDAMMPELTSGFFNVALDFEALAHNTTGHSNIAIGVSALDGNTSGAGNIATGSGALALNKTGDQNIAIGAEALEKTTGGENNIAIGPEALKSSTETNNLAIGETALVNLTSGNNNVALGGPSASGQSLNAGSNNTYISNAGVAAEEGTTRIGTEGIQTRAFVSGIYPTNLVGCFVQVTSEGQLGCNPTAAAEGKEGKEGKTGATGPAGPAGSAAIATFASRAKTLSGNCLAYTDIGPAGKGACPAKTTGFSSSTRLAPTPANGGTVANLYADSSATVSGTDTVLVAVIDNTTGATLLSCTVTSSTPHSCSNASGSGSAAAGDNIEVKLTATGPSGNEKLWRVTFRF